MQSERKKTAVILAGGKSQRFQDPNVEKCLACLNNKPLLQHAIERISGVADEIIVAARDEVQGERIKNALKTATKTKIVFVFDTLKGFGPLAGVQSGLERASSAYCFVLGCDMPFVCEAVVELLFETAVAGCCDAVVPCWENGLLEPLHAVYKKEPTLAATKAAAECGERKLSSLLPRLKNVCLLPVSRVREKNPALETFSNLNSPEILKITLKYRKHFYREIKY